jgi:cytoskeletal protein CcmA (bactofilin family)
MTNDTATIAKWPGPAKAGARSSAVAADLVVDGNVTSIEAVEVQGSFSGQVTAPEILIAAYFTIEGTAIADNLDAQGHISGSVDVRNVVLTVRAGVKAAVIHKRIAIEAVPSLKAS